MTSRYLNLGCGERFHPEWVNLDLRPASPGVQHGDLRKDLPFPDASLDVVYHSHVLEHFSQPDGLRFLGRCRKVLRPGGLLRVVVPDLERIVELYRQALSDALNGQPDAHFAYDWAMIEMYDQTVREFSGGEMVRFVRELSPSQHSLIRSRLGGELDRMVPSNPQSSAAPGSRTLSAFGNSIWRRGLRLLLGAEGLAAYDLGRFRNAGEVHKWMYDRYSLARALESAGFRDIRQCGPGESRIANWPAFNLDTEPDGSTYKPDSLFMEAVRP